MNVSCRQNGADALRAELTQGFAALGLKVEFESVFCLEQCAFGPSAAVDAFLYRAGTGDVYEDCRNWRRPRDVDASASE